ncbi:uncharacterized protein LTR77_001314 [Saxophila tyrrhenica]|uniref:Uncharacterized protein n=1 Tax=Saxophila tyrrhenica TaxID=1690608 RepID=A0AAV9PND1_9PEZI|nr:hypothetical protein LTR77_001314 [Saxophila tyrrhenica]
MQLTSVVLGASLALMAHAVPFHEHSHSHLHHARNADKFPIHITNNCGSDKEFALYQITGDFQMLQMSAGRKICNGETHTLHAPFTGLGLRLSGNADWPTGDQWNPQALAEFGYSSYDGMDGTAYNLSFMEGAAEDIGVSITPDNKECGPKSCTSPSTCGLSQGWTNPDQTADGSPADTVCYHGKTGFSVVWCPSS